MNNLKYGDPINRPLEGRVDSKDLLEDGSVRWELTKDAREEMDKISNQQRVAQQNSGNLLIR